MPPEIAPENSEAWELWLATQTQWRVSFGGLVGLDYPAMKLAADCLGIEMTSRVFAKIRALEKATLKKVNKVPK